MTEVAPRQPALVPLSAVVATALAEDLGPGWSADDDVTARATVPADARVTASFVPRQAGVVAGLDAITETYRQVDPSLEVDLRAADGDPAVPGEPIAVVSGRARAVLAGERTALNLLTHLSGIATATRTLVDAVDGTGCVVRDTRKTLPGLRLVEKAAVLAGGGRNHRMSLVDELLVKDNHVAAAGGMGNAATGALAAADGLPVQIEVDSLAQLDVVLASGGTRVMLDNFSLADTEEGVRRCRALAEETGRPIFVEASGGITIETAPAIAATGVDAVAVGGLTHSSGALDVGLDIAWDTGHAGSEDA
ncbi:carboxylating nicotinate-nucleotide diphosphorylase [Euzebya rosea]|uniref:carboxylating nicotinate-nucleotide diphosphorylase n=1 Tax=Euzebya rosea TaxID=2052804 RepID=UPI000D3ECD60|nr:carboxylating nicotinate-nucleotide diphosphorylase [Euzebya rosea]